MKKTPPICTKVANFQGGILLSKNLNIFTSEGVVAAGYANADQIRPELLFVFI